MLKKKPDIWLTVVPNSVQKLIEEATTQMRYPVLFLFFLII